MRSNQKKIYQKFLKRQKHIEDHLYLFTIKRYNIDIVVDVGAHTGQFGKLLRKQGYNGPIYSFEPSPVVYKRLQKVTKRDKNWYIYKQALGNTIGQYKMFCYDLSHMSSIYQINSYGAKKLGKYIGYTQEKIQMSTFDTFLHDMQLQDKRVFLNLNTQDYDFKILSAITKYYTSIKMLQTSIPVISMYDSNSTSYIGSLKYMENRRFDLLNLTTIERDKDNQKVVMLLCLGGKE